jgi:hypothetical protein
VKRLLSLLLAFVAGAAGCYLTMDWRIGAADGYAKLYATGAMQAYALLDKCQSANQPKWAR